MKLLRKLSTGALGVAIGVTSVIVIPLAAAGPAGAAAGPCTPGNGYTFCQDFFVTGAEQTFPVPSGVTSVLAKVWGAGGGSSPNFGLAHFGGGGGGGFTTGTLSVTPGTSLDLQVGGAGVAASIDNPYDGGGAGGYGNFVGDQVGSSGGGFSVIWSNTNRTTMLLLAGGGGGSGGNDGNGGLTGAPGGGGGATGGDSTLATAMAGGGGTQLSGGLAGTWANICATSGDGTSLNGGHGGIAGLINPVGDSGGGGGGGGFFGGGGGGCQANDNGGGPGGGGSAFIATSITDGSTTAGSNAIDGVTPASPGASTDAMYISPFGQGGASTSARPGLIVLEWNVAPAPVNVTTTGIGTATQTPSIVVPSGDSLTLLDASSNPVTSVVVPNQGEYDVNTTTNVITFTPVFAYTGVATPVTFQETDSNSLTGTATYTPTVTAPPLPTPPALTSTGTGTAVQSVTPQVPVGGSVTLLQGSTPTNNVADPGKGAYSLSQSTLAISFTPQLGYSGVADAVPYQVTDAYGTTASSTYTPTVNPPAGPIEQPLTSSGTAGVSQSVQPVIPTGGSLQFSGPNPLTVMVTGGFYSFNPTSFKLSFAPSAGYTGTPAAAVFTVTDAYGQSVDSTYQPHVVITPAATIFGPTLVLLATQGTAVPITCVVTGGNLQRCAVTLTWIFGGRRQVVGSGNVVIRGAGASGPVVVPVRLNALGHYLAAGLLGVPVSVSASVWQNGNPTIFNAVTTSRFVNNSVVAPMSVYFAEGSSALDPVAISYLATLRTSVTQMRRITCTGDTERTGNAYTDLIVAQARARNVCDYLTRGTGVAASTSGTSQPAPIGTNPQLLRRTDIRLYFKPLT